MFLDHFSYNYARDEVTKSLKGLKQEACLLSSKRKDELAIGLFTGPQ